MDIFNAALFNIFNIAPFDPPRAFDMFNIAPSNPLVETTHQLLLGDRVANNIIPAKLALSGNDKEAFIKNIIVSQLKFSFIIL